VWGLRSLGRKGGFHEKSPVKEPFFSNNSGNLEVFLRLGIDKRGGSSKVRKQSGSRPKLPPRGRCFGAREVTGSPGERTGQKAESGESSTSREDVWVVRVSAQAQE
jgi:hypothetical protein